YFRRVSRDTIGVMSGEQLVQNNAQRIHVAGGGDGLAVDLLWTSIIWSQCSKLRECRLKAVGRGARIKNLSDTKIHKFRHSVRGHKDVARFNIAVNDEPLIGKLHCRTYLQEEIQAVAGALPALLAVTVNGLPLNQFHDKVRSAFFGGATVEQVRNVGVIEAGQNLPLIPESAKHEAGI